MENLHFRPHWTLISNAAPKHGTKTYKWGCFKVCCEAEIQEDMSKDKTGSFLSRADESIEHKQGLICIHNLNRDNGAKIFE